MQVVLDRSRTLEVTPQFFTLHGVWEGLRRAETKDFDQSVTSGVDAKKIKQLGLDLVQTPAEFNTHRKLKRLLDQRANMMEKGEGIDWGMAELLTYASLADEGIPNTIFRPGRGPRNLFPSACGLRGRREMIKSIIQSTKLPKRLE